MAINFSPNFSSLLNSIRENSLQLTLVTGVFDVLHVEHENFLRKAKNLGDVLVVGLESDVRVRDIKGEGRPVNHQLSRVKNLSQLKIADAVFVLPEEFSKPHHHTELLNIIKPNFLAVSSHTRHLEQKNKLMELVGGKVVIVHKHNPEISSTKLIGDK